MICINDIVYALFDAIKRCQLCDIFVHGCSYTLRTVSRHEASQTGGITLTILPHKTV